MISFLNQQKPTDRVPQIDNEKTGVETSNRTSQEMRQIKTMQIPLLDVTITIPDL